MRNVLAISIVVGIWMAAAPIALSQNLRLGAIGGTALTNDYSPYFMPGGTITLPDGTIVPYLPVSARTGSRSVIGGAILGGDFNDRLSLETNAIYRRLHLERQIPTVTWEFPVLAKYRLPLRHVQPFLQAGPSFRTIGNLNTRPSRFGFSAGTGIDWEMHGFRFSPTLRYTRWMSDPGAGIQTKQDQVEILLGVSHAASNRHPFGSRVSIGVEGGFMLNPMARDSVFEYSEQFGSIIYQRTETTYLRSWIVGPVPCWKLFTTFGTEPRPSGSRSRNSSRLLAHGAHKYGTPDISGFRQFSFLPSQ